MRRLIFIILLGTSGIGHATELQAGVLPGLAMVGQAIGVFRVNARLLFGGDFVALGPYGDFKSLAPQVIDTEYGAALRIGHDFYLEAQGGAFHRQFRQPGSSNLSGNGFVAHAIAGWHLSPHFGVDLDLSAKRIASGSLEKRWIVDLLPLLTVRTDF